MLHIAPAMSNVSLPKQNAEALANVPVEESVEKSVEVKPREESTPQQNTSIDQQLASTQILPESKQVLQNNNRRLGKPPPAAVPPSPDQQQASPAPPISPSQPNYAHYVPPPQQYYDYNGLYQGGQVQGGVGYPIPPLLPNSQPMPMPGVGGGGAAGYQQSVPFGFAPGAYQAQSWPPTMMFAPDLLASTGSPQLYSPHGMSPTQQAWGNWDGQPGNEAMVGQQQRFEASVVAGVVQQQPIHQPGPPIQMVPDGHGPEGCNLFVFHIPNEMTNLDLFNFFSPFGNVISARIMVDNDTGRSRGFGFVSFDNVVSAEEAILHMNGLQIGKKRLKVQHKKDKGSYEPGYGPEPGRGGKGKGQSHQGGGGGQYSPSRRSGGGRGGGRSYSESRPEAAEEAVAVPSREAAGEDMSAYMQNLSFGEIDDVQHDGSKDDGGGPDAVAYPPLAPGEQHKKERPQRHHRPAAQDKREEM
jgi:hypothetical protein